MFKTLLDALMHLLQDFLSQPHVTITPMQQVQPEPTPSTTPPTKLLASRLTHFCLAIQSREGYYGPNQLAGYPHGTPAYINNNPGNCRWPFGKPYPGKATGVDKSDFLIFPTYADGLEYLMAITTQVCKGTASISGAYQSGARKLGLKDCSELTIQQYFVIRDPSSDNNDPLSYAKEVAAKVNLPITAQMKELLS